LDKNPGPVSAMSIALIADTTHDAATRDKMLSQLPTYPDGDPSFVKLGALMEAAIAAGPTATPDPAAVTALIDSATDGEVKRGLCAQAAAFCINRAKNDEALTYLKKAGPPTDYYFDGAARILIDSELHAMNIDPLTLDPYPHAKTAAQ
jgi:hypothetical protein